MQEQKENLLEEIVTLVHDIAFSISMDEKDYTVRMQLLKTAIDFYATLK